MASNFNNGPMGPPSDNPPGDTPTAPAGAATEGTPAAPQSTGFVRFTSCRWQQPVEEGVPAAYCTHREVKPYAGTTGFDPDAWCIDCQYYKLRRAPKKRNPDEYRY